MTARTTVDLMQIAAAGGGLDIEVGSRLTVDLMQIAGAAANSGAKVTMRGLGARASLDLMQIASAGRGNVVLVLD
jgi:hypothetical protein